MKLSVIILIISVLMDFTNGDCPSSVNCPDGKYFTYRDKCLYMLPSIMFKQIYTD